MKQLIAKYTNFVSGLRDLPPLLFRLVLAYGFYGPALQKWKNIEGTAQFFAGVNIPYPLANAYIAASTEALGVVLLLLGLGMRFVTLPLMFMMLVAISTVHWSNGFSAGNGGFEIPLYYLLMLFSLLVTGAGRFSLDYLIGRKRP